MTETASAPPTALGRPTAAVRPGLRRSCDRRCLTPMEADGTDNALHLRFLHIDQGYPQPAKISLPAPRNPLRWV